MNPAKPQCAGGICGVDSTINQSVGKASCIAQNDAKVMLERVCSSVSTMIDVIPVIPMRILALCDNSHIDSVLHIKVSAQTLVLVGLAREPLSECKLRGQRPLPPLTGPQKGEQP